MNLIERKEYLNFLERNQGRQIIKVVTGARRAGKSTLFSMFQNKLLKEGAQKEQIQTINFEDIAFEDLLEYHALYRHVSERLIEDKCNYIFLDEIQHVPKFEKAVDSLFIKKNVDIYITGSNAYMMSGELATLLSGRFVELSILPLSFKEFYTAQNENQYKFTLRELYEKYITESSFPYALQLNGNQRDIMEYLSGIYHTVLLKDIMTRMRINDPKMLESVIKYVFANIGNLMSSRKIANAMTSQGRKIDVKTVEKYLQGLLDSLLLYSADRFDIKSKELLKFNPKYYVVDPALRFLLVGKKGRDTGHILENVVYLELLRRGYKVYVGSDTEGEVDFIAQSASGLHYFQVSETTLQTETLERELKPLKKIRDSYPKTLLTLDEVGAEADYEGIRKTNALKWLLRD
ncbi:MAG: ATP-binding protein [Selenomonadaceae bacterium]|nr:ATP-binding protein [Selenomonadaceae bacterium]